MFEIDPSSIWQNWNFYRTSEGDFRRTNFNIICQALGLPDSLPHPEDATSEEDAKKIILFLETLSTSIAKKYGLLVDQNYGK